MPLAITGQDDRRDLLLSRAERGNSLSADLVEALLAALEDAEAEGVGLLALQGEGRNFCTGFDLGDLERTGDGELLARFVRIEELLARLWSAPFMTLAVARGRTFGAGADLFATCSTRLALPDASFSFPGAAFGLVLGTRRLAARIGRDAALSIVTSGRVIGADEALALGLVTEIVEEDALTETLDGAWRDATRLDLDTVAALRRSAGDSAADLDRDLAALVRSAARPGLVQRIMAYRAKAQEQHKRDRASATAS